MKCSTRLKKQFHLVVLALVGFLFMGLVSAMEADRIILEIENFSIDSIFLPPLLRELQEIVQKGTASYDELMRWVEKHKPKKRLPNLIPRCPSHRVGKWIMIGIRIW